jgi:hypothetical protein
MQEQDATLVNPLRPHMTFVNDTRDARFANRPIDPVLRDCTSQQRLTMFVHGRTFKVMVLCSALSVVTTAYGLIHTLSLEALVIAKAVEFAFHLIPAVLILVECVNLQLAMYCIM